MFSRLSHTIPILLFFGIFSLYLYTSPPGATQYADSSELITASYLLGIPHPPGYPIFVLVGKLFSFLPFGEIAWRYSVMTSLLGALTVVLVYLILVKILATRDKRQETRDDERESLSPVTGRSSLIYTHIPALTGALSLAFSYIFWLYSIVPEVWAFNSFFTALLLYLGVRWHQHTQSISMASKDQFPNPNAQSSPNVPTSKRFGIWFLGFYWSLVIGHWSFFLRFLGKNNIYPFIIAVTFSLATFSHQVIVLLVPAFVYLIYITDPHLLWPTRRWLKVLPGFLFGLLPIIYFPIATNIIRAPVDMGDVKDLDSLWKLLSRYYYSQTSTDPGHAYLQQNLRLDDRLSELTHYVGILAEYFTIPLFVLAVLGVGYFFVRMARGHFKDPIPFLGIALFFTGIFFSMYTTMGVERLEGNYNAFGVTERTYIAGVVVAALFIGLGAHALLHIARVSKFLSVPLMGIALLALPVYPLTVHFENVNKSDFYLGEDLGYNFFVNVEPNAIVFVRGDMPTFAVYYYHYVQGKRPDVTLVPISLAPWEQKPFLERNPGLWDTPSTRVALIFRDIIADNIDKRPIYTTGLMEDELSELGLRANPYVLSPRGILGQLSRAFDPQTDKDFWGNMRWRNPDEAEKYYDWFAREIIEQYMIGHYNSHSWYIKHGYYDLAERQLTEMRRMDPTYFGTSLAAQYALREGGVGRAPRVVRTSAQEAQEEAFRLWGENRMAAAFGMMAYLVDLEPENLLYRIQLAKVYALRGWPEEAESELKKILEINPEHEEAKNILKDHGL